MRNQSFLSRAFMAFCAVLFICSAFATTPPPGHGQKQSLHAVYSLGTQYISYHAVISDNSGKPMRVAVISTGGGLPTVTKAVIPQGILFRPNDWSSLPERSLLNYLYYGYDKQASNTWPQHRLCSASNSTYMRV